jgi:two-component system NtrC family sensor kinase
MKINLFATDHHSVSEITRNQFEAVLLNNIREALVAWDISGKIIYWNPAAYLLYGWTPGERIGQFASEVYFPIFNPNIFQPGPENTAGMDIERLCRTKSGREVWVSGRTTALRETWGERSIIGYMDLARDVSERVQMLDRLHSMYIQLAENRRLATVGELASNIAHQINNPLTTIIAEAQLALTDLDRESPVRTSFSAIEEAGWRAQEVIDTLMQFSQAGDESQQEVSIRNCLDRALTLVGASLALNRVELKVDCPGSIHLVHANQAQMVNLWVNLLLSTRALLVDESEHLVLIKIRDENGQVAIEMIQSGVKEIPADIYTLLEPSTNPVGQGSGVELSICREITRQNRGTLSLRGIEKGILIRIDFPAEV